MNNQISDFSCNFLKTNYLFIHDKQTIKKNYLSFNFYILASISSQEFLGPPSSTVLVCFQICCFDYFLGKMLHIKKIFKKLYMYVVIDFPYHVTRLTCRFFHINITDEHFVIRGLVAVKKLIK